MKIILASSSPSRKRQLKQLKLQLKTISPNIDESAKPHESATELTQRLAFLKAKKVGDDLIKGSKSTTHKKSPFAVIGSDQVLVLPRLQLTSTFKKNSGDAIFGKPKNLEQAYQHLQLFSEKTMYFSTALAVLVYQIQTGLKSKVFKKTVKTHLQFKTLNHHTITDYLKREPQALGCAGSFCFEGLGLSLIKSIQSPDPSAIYGLPLIGLCRILERIGYKI